MNRYESLIRLNGRQFPVSDLQIKFNPAGPAFDQFTVVVTLEINGDAREVELDGRGEPLTPGELK
ncbi:MAG: hypothetical protein V4508_13720 [Pseudomonadota bacterium]